MKGSNWIRMVLCGIVAGMVWYLVSVVFLSLFAPDFVASVRRSAPHPPLGGEFFFAIDVAMGIWAVWLYSAIAPRYGARPTTMAIAGVAWWILKTLQSAKWAGLGFVEFDLEVLALGVATLAATVLASAVGMWLYRNVSESSPQSIAET